MNQILITEKLYVTPELKRSKNIYKISFFISLFLFFMLGSFYVYGQYDRNKNEELSQDILTGMIVEQSDIAKDTTTINENDEVWIIDLDSPEQDDNVEVEESKNNVTISSTDKGNGTIVGRYTASNGVTYNTVGSINIPSIDVNYPILADTSVALLKVSVCKFWGANPNEVGNLCIAGHNYRNKRFFSKVPNLSTGDIIEITDLYKNTVKYKVYDKYTVDPKDVTCTSQLTNGKKIVTLITCTNNNKQRVVVKAEAI